MYHRLIVLSTCVVLCLLMVLIFLISESQPLAAQTHASPSTRANPPTSAGAGLQTSGVRWPVAPDPTSAGASLQTSGLHWPAPTGLVYQQTDNLPEHSSIPKQFSTFPHRLHLPLVLKNPSSTSEETPTPSPTSTSTPTPRPTTTPTPTLTPTPLPPDGVVVLSSAFYTKTLGISKRIYISGEIQNQTTAVVQVTQVHADLRNAAGHIIGTASKGPYLPMLRPGERSPFKIAANLPPTFDRYSIRINFEPGDEQPLAPLRVQNDTVYRVEDTGEIRWLYILGEVPDDLSTSVQDLLVAATLYDEDDQVAYVAATDEDHSSAYLSALSPGQRSPFRLSLHPLTYDHVGWTVAYHTASQPPEIGPLVASASDFIESASDSLFVFGEVANTTPQNIRSVRVVGTCYDVAGAVVNAASANLRSGFRTVLAPGKKAPFLLDLSAGPSAYDNRTLSVTYEGAPDDATTAWAIPSFSQYHEQEQNGGILLEWMDLFGEVRNEDQQDIRSVRVIATFYDEAGMVVNNALALAYRKRIEAGGKSPFKLTVNFGPLDWESVDWTVDYQTAPGGSLPELRATNVQCSEAGRVLVIRGDVKNIDTQTVTSAEVYVTLYDAEETVINATRAVLDSPLEPRASVPFEVRFSQHFEGCDNYEVQIDG